MDDPYLPHPLHLCGLVFWLTLSHHGGAFFWWNIRNPEKEHVEARNLIVCRWCSFCSFNQKHSFEDHQENRKNLSYHPNSSPRKTTVSAPPAKWMVGRQTFHFEMAPLFREHCFRCNFLILFFGYYVFPTYLPNFPPQKKMGFEEVAQQKGWKLPGSTVMRQMHLAAMRELVAATSQQIHEREAVPWQITWMPACGEDDWFTSASRFGRWLKFSNPGYKYKIQVNPVPIFCLESIV